MIHAHSCLQILLYTVVHYKQLFVMLVATATAADLHVMCDQLSHG